MSTVHMYMYRIILHDMIIWVTDAFLNQPPNKGHLFITDKPSCTNVSVIKRFHCIRHNELRNITASLLKETCHEVATEPSLQPVTSETLDGASTTKHDGAHLDIVAYGEVLLKGLSSTYACSTP